MDVTQISSSMQWCASFLVLQRNKHMQDTLIKAFIILSCYMFDVNILLCFDFKCYNSVTSTAPVKIHVVCLQTASKCYFSVHKQYNCKYITSELTSSL